MDKYLGIQESLITVEEMAKILCISRSLAYRIVQRGEIPSVRINTAVRIHPEDLGSFILQKRVNQSSSETDPYPTNH